MSDGRFEVGVTLPLDSHGFLRRECPTCEREFKSLPSNADDEDTSGPDGGYHCPYCRVQAPPGSWWTPAQLELAQGTAMSEVVGPMLKGFAREFGGTYSGSDEPEALSETDDMTRVDFACHPEEPVKVLDDWNKPAYCLICGQPASH